MRHLKKLNYDIVPINNMISLQEQLRSSQVVGWVPIAHSLVGM